MSNNAFNNREKILAGAFVAVVIYIVAHVR